MPLRFVFALHNHQPVGNFGHVFEHAYRDSYRPFLELLDEYPEIPIALHTSGPLMEWLVAAQARIHRTAAPHGPARTGRDHGRRFPRADPAHDSARAIASARFQPTKATWKIFWRRACAACGCRSACGSKTSCPTSPTPASSTRSSTICTSGKPASRTGRLFGYHLSEDNGRLLRIFAAAEPLRYLVPYRDPNETLAYFGDLAVAPSRCRRRLRRRRREVRRLAGDVSPLLRTRLAAPLLRRAARQSPLDSTLHVFAGAGRDEAGGTHLSAGRQLSRDDRVGLAAVALERLSRPGRRIAARSPLGPAATLPPRRQLAQLQGALSGNAGDVRAHAASQPAHSGIHGC